MTNPLQPFPSRFRACVPHITCFDWSVLANGELTIETRAGNVTSLGDTSEYLTERYGPVAFEPPLGFRIRELRMEVNGVKPNRETPYDEVTRVSDRDLPTQARILTLVGESIGYRLDVMLGWRMLAFNAAVHFQLGPCLTVATDGTRVVLWSEPRFGCDFTIAHRRNVNGYVTSTPKAIDDWNYAERKPGVTVMRQVTKAKETERQAKINKLIEND